MNDRTLKRWLIASLVFNLFLAACIAGGAWRWWTAQQAAAATQSRGLRFAAEELSAEQRRAFLLGLRSAREGSAALVQSALDSRQEVFRLLKAPQFDSAAVTRALANTRDIDAALRARVETSVIDFAATLSLDDRQKLANGLAQRSTLSPPYTKSAKP